MEVILEKKGFTLIEVLVAVTTIFLLAGLTFAGFANFNERQKLISSGQTLKNVIRDVQSRAYNQEIDCSICSCSPQGLENLQGWYIDLARREFFGKCGAATFPSPPYSFSLPAEIEITPYVTPQLSSSWFLFRPPPLTVDFENAFFCLKSKNLASLYYLIKVNAAGVVSESKGLINSCP